MKIKITKEEIFQADLDTLCKLGSEFLKRLEHIGVEAVLVTDRELKSVITKMIAEYEAEKQLNKDREKERKGLVRLNKVRLNKKNNKRKK